MGGVHTVVGRMGEGGTGVGEGEGEKDGEGEGENSDEGADEPSILEGSLSAEGSAGADTLCPCELGAREERGGFPVAVKLSLQAEKRRRRDSSAAKRHKRRFFIIPQ